MKEYTNQTNVMILLEEIVKEAVCAISKIMQL